MTQRVMLRTLILMPSTHGFVFFTIGYALYAWNLIGYETPSMELHLVCLMTILTFFMATILSAKRFQHLGEVASTPDQSRVEPTWKIVFLLHIVGLFGIYMHFKALGSYFGSTEELILRLTMDTGDVRTAAGEFSSPGTQVSYLGWIAIWLTVYKRWHGPTRLFLVVLLFMQVAANLLYVDRTRPMWILFLILLLLALNRYPKLTNRRVIFFCTTAGVAFISMFVAIGTWVGKIALNENRPISNVLVGLEPAYFYATSGFAYLNRILVTEEPDYSVMRSLYPLMTIATKLEVVDPPPPQVNEFLNIPQSTNVGTFIEPMFRDGGVALIVLGVIGHSFLFNWLAVRFLISNASLCRVGWAALCFVNAMSMFTPKYSSTPTWLVVGLAVLASLFRQPTRLGHQSFYENPPRNNNATA